MIDRLANFTRATALPKVETRLFSAKPAWIWSAKGDRILWSNAAGCRFFSTDTIADLLLRKFRGVSPATVEIARVARKGSHNEKVKRELKFFLGMSPVTIQANLTRLTFDPVGDCVFVEVKKWSDPDQNGASSGSNPDDFVRLYNSKNLSAALLAQNGKIKCASDDFPKAEMSKTELKSLFSLADNKDNSIHHRHGNFLLHAVRLKEPEDDPRCLIIAAGIKGVSEDKLVSFPLLELPQPEAVKEDIPEFNVPDISAEDAIITAPDEGVKEASDQDTSLPEAITDSATDDSPSNHDQPENVITLTQSDETAETNGETVSSGKSDRFAFELTADSTVKTISAEFTETIGEKHGSIKNQKFLEVVHELNLPIADKFSTHFTSQAIWSETLLWPIGDQGVIADPSNPPDRVPIVLTAMPIFDRDRTFEGFRGFGTIRLAEIAQHPSIETYRASEDNEQTEESPRSIPSPLNEDEPSGRSTDAADEHIESVDETVSDLFADSESPTESVVNNIIPLHKKPQEFTQSDAEEESFGTLSKPEKKAFEEIAKALNARMEDVEEVENEEENKDQPTVSQISSSIGIPNRKRPIESSPDTRSTEERLTNIDETAASAIEGMWRPKTIRRPINASVNRSTEISNPADTETNVPPNVDLAPIAGNQIEESYEAANGDIKDGVLNRLPLGLLVSRNREILFANQAVLDFLGYDAIEDFEEAGGLNKLFAPDPNLEPGIFQDRDILKTLVLNAEDTKTETALAQGAHVNTSNDNIREVEVRLQSGIWREEEALLMTLTGLQPSNRPPLSADELISQLVGQSTDVMDIASDGILIANGKGELLHANASAEALFGHDRRNMRAMVLTELFAEESHKSIGDYLDGLSSNGVASVLNDGREVIGKEIGGGLIPLFMTMGRIDKDDLSDDPIYCAVLRDITQWKGAEEELIKSRRLAENANAQKSDFLAKISHEIRTPLNAIIGFSEVMMGEHFGPMENKRYREYARDIHASGSHLVSLVNDLLDLSKIEAGKLDLDFSAVTLNPIIQECVAIMQPDANRERIIIRTSLLDTLPPIVADPRSIRQIALNLLSNAVKFTDAGGQVIISTMMEESGEVALRVRDTGIGMSDKDLEEAMQPFRQVTAASGNRTPGTGLGLPLTKALAEANRARFLIDSRVNYGTLIQVIFPNERVLAQ